MQKVIITVGITNTRLLQQSFGAHMAGHWLEGVGEQSSSGSLKSSWQIALKR